MKEYIIYYNRMTILEDKEMVILESDCPLITHLSDNDIMVNAIGDRFVKDGMWSKYICPQTTKYKVEFKR